MFFKHKLLDGVIKTDTIWWNLGMIGRTPNRSLAVKTSKIPEKAIKSFFKYEQKMCLYGTLHSHHYTSITLWYYSKNKGLSVGYGPGSLPATWWAWPRVCVPWPKVYLPTLHTECDLWCDWKVNKIRRAFYPITVSLLGEGTTWKCPPTLPVCYPL